MRSTPELARLVAMAVPLEVNSSVMLSRIAHTETVQVTAPSGRSTAATNRMIFLASPNRGFDPAGGSPATSPVRASPRRIFMIIVLLARLGPFSGEPRVSRAVGYAATALFQST